MVIVVGIVIRYDVKLILVSVRINIVEVILGFNIEKL